MSTEKHSHGSLNGFYTTEMILMSDYVVKNVCFRASYKRKSTLNHSDVNFIFNLIINSTTIYYFLLTVVFLKLPTMPFDWSFVVIQ